MVAGAPRVPLHWPARLRDRAGRWLRRLKDLAGHTRTAVAGAREARRRERDRGRLRLDPGLARRLLEPVEEPAPFPGVAGLTSTVFDRQRCEHCRGLHSRVCPAVAEIEYHSDGKVRRVAYFPHGMWPEDQVLWREDIEEAAAWTDTDAAA